jgi:tetratricopeptide (TPR) repeat protein
VDAAEHLGHDQQAVESLQALLLLDPPDLANVHYRLATHCWRTGSKEQARRHVLQAIEEAPRYRAACQLLLQILEAADAAPATDKQGE